MPLRTAGRGLRGERRRFAAQCVVLALVVAGTTAFATLHKTVALDVDGAVTSVSAFGRTVGDVLAAEGVEVGERDLVAPGLGSLVADGSQVVVRHGREVVVEVDGDPRTVWTTALTVEEVLAEMGLRGELRTSASRSADLDGALRVSTLKTVHVAIDGVTQDVATTAPTVREVLVELGVVLGEHDRVSVSLEAAAVDGLVVMVDRIAGATRSETVAEPFEVVRQDDSSLVRGREVVAQTGREGSRVITYTAYEVGGVEIGREVLAESVVLQPVAQVIRVGTAAVPSGPVDLGDGVWTALAQCESGGNPSAVSASGRYYGLFQFSLPTWQAVGGSGLPTEASPEEQLLRAQSLQARSGWGQWPACAAKLGLI